MGMGIDTLSINTQFLGYWVLSMGWVDIAKPIPKTQLFWGIKLWFQFIICIQFVINCLLFVIYLLFVLTTSKVFITFII